MTGDEYKIGYRFKRFLHRLFGVFNHTLNPTVLEYELETNSKRKRNGRTFNPNVVNKTYVRGKCLHCNKRTTWVKISNGTKAPTGLVINKLITNNPGWILPKE